MARLGWWMVVLALTTAAYGALAGPVLHALFGGAPLHWPAWIAGTLPAPSVETLRSVLPWLILAISALKGLAYYRQTVGLAGLGERFGHRLRSRAVARLLSLPPDAARARGAGELLGRALDDASASRRMLTEGFAAVARDGVQVVALLGVCLAIDWRMALVVFGVYPLAFWPIARLGKRLKRRAGRAREHSTALLSLAHDQLDRLPAIQLAGRGAAEGAAFGAASVRAADAVVHEARTRAFASPLTEVMGAATLAISLSYASRLISAGEVAPEHILSFLVGVMLLYQPVKGLARAQTAIQPGLAALDRVCELLDWPEVLPIGGELVPPVGAVIRFDSVGVERGGRWALKDLSVALPKEGLVVIAGPNGAGKSTLLACLAGVLLPSEGRLTLADRPLLDYDLRRWRQQIGWVGQSLSLGRGSLLQNIDGEQLSAEALKTVATVAGLEPLLSRLEDGWNTSLGDRGAGLSGGELQRLALARALVGEPKMLVLDEPAAHLDVDATAALGVLLRELAKTRLVIWVTHGAPALDGVDRLIALEDGALRRR